MSHDRIEEEDVTSALLVMAAAALLDASGSAAFLALLARHPVVSSGAPMTVQAARLVALIATGERAEAGRQIDSLRAMDDGHGWPSAWAAVGEAELSSDPASRAAHLVRAARLLDDIDRPLDAAVRRVEAAELDPGAVPVHQLSADAASITEAGASWMAARARALASDTRTSQTQAPALGLTKRELEVAEAVASGLSNREVAQRLFVSVRTITSHLDHIYAKLGVSSRGDLAEVLSATNP